MNIIFSPTLIFTNFQVGGVREYTQIYDKKNSNKSTCLPLLISITCVIQVQHFSLILIMGIAPFRNIDKKK
jgi:hypothetical protein